MPKIYHVRLSLDERADLEALVARRSANAEPVKRALMLLALDETGDAPPLLDTEVADRYRVTTRTVERLRRRLVEHGLDLALHGVPRGPREPARKFDGTTEAHLVALRCSAPPEDRSGWTLELLADRMVALGYVDSISPETVRRMLKKTRSSPGVSRPG
jgi:transposase